MFGLSVRTSITYFERNAPEHTQRAGISFESKKYLNSTARLEQDGRKLTGENLKTF